MGYTEFLQGKAQSVPAVGIDTAGLAFNPALKDFQRYIVELALQKGRYALFEDCGLGKTLQQLEWARHIVAHTARPVLVLTPLAVAAQTVAEGAKFGIEVRRLEPGLSLVAGLLDAAIYVTNYEQVENLDPTAFAGVVLDESSILKNFTGQTKRLLLNYFRDTPYRLCCTATPSPNDHMELGNHAEFLGVMPSNEMISRWFINDTMKMGTYRLKHHAKADFWRWVRSWAMCIGSPADLGQGFDATGYCLPPLELIEELVEVPAEAVPGSLFADETVTATTYSAALRATMHQRLGRAAEIVRAHPGEPFLIWVSLNEEGELLRQLLPEAVEVSGADSLEQKEARLLGFARGEFTVLITKGKIAQFGLNYQHCGNQLFASLDFSFEKVYQSIRRSLRFGRVGVVKAWLLTVRTMGNVVRAIKEKQAAFDEMRREMVAGIAEDGAQERRQLTQDFAHCVERGPGWTMHLGDCCEVARLLPDASIDFGIHSPPFANLYIYSDSVRDMGNCRDDAEFFEQYRFLIREHFRILKSGRLVAVHCKNLVDYATTSGRAGQRDFRGDIIRAYEAEGFKYHAEVTIEKDPVIEMQRTKANGLLYKTLRKDSSFTRTGMAEYLVVFRKWPAGSEELAACQPINWKTPANYPLDKWQQVANPTWQTGATREDLLEMLYAQSRQLDAARRAAPWLNLPAPVWHDIQQTNVLNIQQARESRDEKHICPLQLDCIEKAVELWTNPGEVVFTPFGGIGSELYQSLKMGRQAIGIELKESYFSVAVRNCRAAVRGQAQTTLFDLLASEPVAQEGGVRVAS